MIYIHSPEDVLLQKLKRFELGGRDSDRQWNDIIGLLQQQSPNLDQQYLKTWSGELKVKVLFETAVQQAKQK